MLLSALLLAANCACADQFAELAEFSSFPKVDPNELASGKVLTARSAPMTNPRQLSVQACYIVRNSAPKTVELLRHWNGTAHPPLKVYLEGVLSAKPAPENFASLDTAPANFLTATQKLDREHFQFSASEAEQFSAAGEGARASAIWGMLLARRAAAFVAGGLAKQPAYAGRETLRASDEAAAMLDAQPKIRAQFSALAASALGGSDTAQLYWNMFDADGQAHVTLGAFYTRPSSGGGTQALDLRYYGSGGFFVHLTFYQFWSIDVQGAPATLVWRGDLLSSASLAPLRGLERTAAGGAMMRQIEKTTGFFQKDASAGR